MRWRSAVLVLVLVAGCGLAPQEDPSRFYTLSALPARDGTGERLRGVVIGIGPIVLPAYLERSEMVTRVAPNRLEFSPTERWAEPLRRDVGRVLAVDIDLLTGADQVLTFPWFGGGQPDYIVELTVQRFERTSDGTTQLVATWVLRDGLRRERLAGDDTALHEAVTSADMESTAAAMSRLLGSLAQGVADAIRRVAATRGGTKGGRQ